ncbi:MAG: VWA domain-containing protein [Chloroflexi bacterium]|nr:VWA domain-containing protein [Chloroflexota bacterium]
MGHKGHKKRGQILLIFAGSILALLAITGLALDFGQYLLQRAHARRAVDAAALAAAAHFRGQYTDVATMRAGMEAAAREVLALNNIDPLSMRLITTLDIDPDTGRPICNDPVKRHQDPYRHVCIPLQRKKVWVQIEASAPMAFMRIFGFDEIRFRVDATGEAAALDVVLVLDISTSMVAESQRPGESQADTVQRCNPTNSCYPFEYVRAAAKRFAERILDLPCNDPNNPADCMEQDRMALVVFSTGWERNITEFRGTGFVSVDSSGRVIDRAKWFHIYDSSDTSSPENINTALSKLKVYPDATSECADAIRNYDDTSLCPNTNIGGGLKLAGDIFSPTTPEGLAGRPDALWVVVLLTDGAANTTFPTPEDLISGGDADRNGIPDRPLDTLPFGYCPPPLNSMSWYSTGRPPCRDADADTVRLDPTDPNFDADDYARYQAHYVACSPTNPDPSCAMPGQGAVIFTIGLGEAVERIPSYDDKPHGAALLRYIANLGDDGQLDTGTADPCFGVPYNPYVDKQCGNYYYRRSGSNLQAVFEDIARRVFTRLSH